MTGNIKELAYIVAFLNEKPVAGGSTILTDAMSESASNELRNTLQIILTHLVAPDVLVPHKAKREAKQKLKRNILGLFLTPTNVLNALVKLINEHVSKPLWELKKEPGKNGTIEIRGFRGSLINTVRPHIWDSLAKVLETGEISKLGLCMICLKFFIKNRDWQKCCDDTECKRKYDNRQSAERKARARKRRKRAEAKPHRLTPLVP
jgi:hypothetical protein